MMALAHQHTAVIAFPKGSMRLLKLLHAIEEILAQGFPRVSVLKRQLGEIRARNLKASVIAVAIKRHGNAQGEFIA